LKKQRGLVLAIALSLVFVSCSTFAAVKPVKLILGHVFTAEHYYNKACLNFKQLVEKSSKGQISIDVFPASQLGSDVEMLQATRTGAQHMILIGSSGLVTCYPKIAAFSLPYIYRDQQHFSKVLGKGKSIVDEKELVDKSGVKILAFWTRSARHLSTNIPVNKLEDLNGLKIRVPENPMFLACWQALGAITTALPWSDVYTALATRTIDGQENPLDTFYDNKLYEQQKYIALTAHVQDIMGIFFNNKTWNGLTSTQKKILTNAALKSGNMLLDIVANIEKEYYDKLLQKGIKFTKPDLASFREKTRIIWSKYGDKVLIRKIEAIK
jgi:tripartite ATP-independent transporter DctP family solute receptor